MKASRIIKRALGTTEDTPKLEAVQELEALLAEHLGSPRRAIQQRIIENARRVAHTRIPVFLQGGSSSGYKRLAQFIHFSSQRRDAALAYLDCRDFLAIRVANALFSAPCDRVDLEDKQSYCELVQGGTLFLNHVEHLPVFVQEPLLNMLKQRTEGKPVDSANIRLITAGHDDFLLRVEQRQFNKTLYRLLTVYPINLAESE